jgi:hypothetical protein
MKHLKKFENFEEEDLLARPAEDFEVFSSEEEEEEDCAPCGGGNEEEEELEEEDLEGEEEVKDWNDAQTLERVKSFESFITEGKKKAKPDFLDLDKDGDKKEPMKKAAKDAKGKKEDKKEDKKDSKKDSEKKDDVMLTPAQRKLPPALRDRIAKSQSKK